MSHAPAWWEDVEHLREAAERRIAERERAQREGREPVALTPLRPLSDAERATPAREPRSPSPPTPLAPAPKVRTGRFRRATTAVAPQGPHASTGGVATATRTAPTAGALALDVAVEPEPTLDPWTAPPEVDAPRAPERPVREERSGAARTPRPARDEAAARPTRREELARLAEEQQRAAPPPPRAGGGPPPPPPRREELARLAGEQQRAAATAARARTTDAHRAGTAIAGRRTIEIRGQAARRPVIAAVPDPVDAPQRRRR